MLIMLRGRNTISYLEITIELQNKIVMSLGNSLNVETQDLVNISRYVHSMHHSPGYYNLHSAQHSPTHSNAPVSIADTIADFFSDEYILPMQRCPVTHCWRARL